MPAEIVDGQGPLDELIEFVDTLYNTVVIGSIGVATPTFSTDIDNRDDKLIVKRIAQHLAIVHYQLRHAGGASRQRASALPGSIFEVYEAKVKETSADRAVVRDDIRRVYDRAKDSLPGLFEVRARRGDVPGQRRSKFWTGLDKLREAQVASNAKAARSALEKHVAYVSRILGDKIGFPVSSNRSTGVVCGFICAAGTTVLSGGWALPLMVQGLIAGAGGGAGVVAPDLVAAYPRRQRARRRAAALLEIVDL